MSEKQIKIIEKFTQVHQDLYDYSLVEYKTTKDKVIIICKQNLKLYLENKNNYIIKYEHSSRVYSPRSDVNLVVYGRSKIIKLSEI